MAISGFLSLPSSYLLSQGVDRWFRPASDPPVLPQPGGASESSGDSPGGHLPPAPASQLPLPWQQLDRRSQGKAPPGSAQHRRGHRETEAPERRPAEDLGEVGRRDWKAVIRGREAGRTEMVGRGRQRMDRHKEGKGCAPGRRGEGLREKGREKSSSSETERGRRGKREGGRGMEAAKSDGTGRREAAGLETGSPAWPSPARPGLPQPPVTVQLPHLGPTMRSVLPWGGGKINGVQDKRSKKLFVLLSCLDCNEQGPAGKQGIIPEKPRLAGPQCTPGTAAPAPRLGHPQPLLPCPRPRGLGHLPEPGLRRQEPVRQRQCLLSAGPQNPLKVLGK